jgi:hypothetical protein
MVKRYEPALKKFRSSLILDSLLVGISYLKIIVPDKVNMYTVFGINSLLKFDSNVNSPLEGLG